jgi:hypothetical protein
MGCNAFWVKMNHLLIKGQSPCKAFCEYIDVFVKIFLDGFTIFYDLSIHLEKLIILFFKCKKMALVWI